MIMKTEIKVRNQTHVFEPAGDIAYRKNTDDDAFRKRFKQWWTDEIALAMALAIAGADPVVVTAPSSPFKRAAIDMYDFMTGVQYRYDKVCDFFSFDPRPMYGDTFVTITYYKRSNHRPVQITYFNDGEVHYQDMQLSADYIHQKAKGKF